MSGGAARRLAVAGPMQPGPGRGGPAASPGGTFPPGDTSLAGGAPRLGAGDPGLAVLVSHLPLPSPLPRPGGLSLSLAAGQLLILSGRSGCGKTTVLRALAGELATGSRAVLVGGLPPGEHPAGHIVLVARDDSVPGGEARRLSLARATAMRPRLLLLDEPTEGLDPATAAVVLTRTRDLLPRATIVAAIHDKDLPFTAGLDGRRLCLDHAAILLAE